METALALRQRGWRLSEEDIRRGLASVKWPARFEVLSRRPLFILDGGHNPQCIDSLMQNVRDYLPDMRRIFLVGVLGDKDYRQMFEKCAPLADGFVTVTPDSPRALPSHELAELLRGCGRPVKDCGDIREGIREALRQVGDGKAVCAFGSLYMCGAIEEFFADWDKKQYNIGMSE
jgi:dihydrofolate synthase/folylpolyglutamate synthase